MARDIRYVPSVREARPDRELRPSESAAEAPAVAMLLALQRSAGNRAVARAIGRSGRALARFGGWSDARAGGWNAADRAVGRTVRIPIEGLTRGNAAADPQNTDPRNTATNESAANRAIAVVPGNVDWGRPVEVLLHFHGHNVGYRERANTSTTGTPPGTVRDVEVDEIEQQLQSSGRSMVGILPQGTTSSGFSITDPEAYVDEVFQKIPGHLPLTVQPQRGRIVVSGHSGGGPAATASARALQAAAGADETHWLAASPLFLFDAINGTGELADVRRLLTAWLDQDLAILTAAGPRAAALLAQRGVRFYSTYTGGVYHGTNVGGTWESQRRENGQLVTVTNTVSPADSVRGHRDAWFARHRGALGPLEAPLREQYKIEHVAGSHDYTVGTGHAASATDRNQDISSPPTAGPGGGTPNVPNYTPGTGHLEQALAHLPGGSGGSGGSATAPPPGSAQEPALARMPRTLARIARPPGPVLARQPHPAPAPQPQPVTPTPTSSPVATPDGHAVDDPFQPVRDGVTHLAEADAAVTAAAHDTAAARRAARRQRDSARTSLQTAVLTLATTLRNELPPRSMLDGYLARSDVTDVAKVETLGRLSAEVERMEFLLGRMYHRGAGTWETGGMNRGAFPDVYRAAVGGDAGQPWCTKFSGYARSRLGFHAAPGSATTTMFQSGWRLQHWSETGATLGAHGDVQTTAADQTVASGAGGSTLVATEDWRTLTHDLTAARRDAHRHHQDEAAARRAVTDRWLETHPHPQAGDIVVKTRGAATGNAYSGGQSHTMMVERFDGHFVYTIEGNRGDQVGARRMDLTDPADTGQIIFLTRLGTQFFGDPSVPEPEREGLAGLVNDIIYSDALLVGLMHEVNARLVEIDASMGWIASSDADASVYEWQTGGTGPVHGAGVSEE